MTQPRRSLTQAERTAQLIELDRQAHRARIVAPATLDEAWDAVERIEAEWEQVHAEAWSARAALERALVPTPEQEREAVSLRQRADDLWALRQQAAAHRDRLQAQENDLPGYR
jgi:hypothetical protein